MKIVITPLQVSQTGSSGHFHPAVKIGSALSSRGHQVYLLPLPAPPSASDYQLAAQHQLQMLEPPLLPADKQLVREKLAHLANHPDTAWQAYQSFLAAPLPYQFEAVKEIINNIKPDIILYDLMTYAGAIAGRLCGIPDLGYCAGLKLAAPITQTRIYQNMADKVIPEVKTFFHRYGMSPDFHQLELLSTTHQLVFTTPQLMTQITPAPLNTFFAGPLTKRLTYPSKKNQSVPKPYAILTFGSALDPANYPAILSAVTQTAKSSGLHLLINSRQMTSMTNEYVTISPWLPLEDLLEQAALVVHHGGANLFSECITAGAPQIIIPLMNDQPVQAALLQQTGAGIALLPEKVTIETLDMAFKQLLDLSHPCHLQIKLLRQDYQQLDGATTTVNLIENIANRKGSLCA